MFRSVRLLFGSIGLVVISAIVGCEPPPPAVYPVSGEVTLNGAPMAEGDVAFVNVAEAQREVLAVRDGKFAGEIRAGQKRIEIFSYREEKQGVEMYGDQAPISKVLQVASKFNSESKLVENVNTQGENKYKFDVTSK